MMAAPPPPEIKHFIADKQHFIILGHTDPDGDCVASQLVTASFLRRLGKTAVCLAKKPFTRNEIIRFGDRFSYTGPIIPDLSSAAVIAVDCSTLDRAAGYNDKLADLPLLMIDHHASGRPFGTVRYIDAKAPSTTVLILQLMKTLGMAPLAEEAELLLFGLCTDTGFFRHLETGTGSTLTAAAELVDRGASLKKVHAMMYGGKSTQSRILLGKLLSRIEFFCEDRCIVTYMTREDLKQHGEEAKDSDTLYSLLQGIAGAIIVLLLREETDGTQTVGIRTNHTIDAGSLAARFGGGGHERAAGFSSTLSVQNIRRELVQVVSKELPSI